MPRFLEVPRTEYDLACPHCQEVMREKDHRFGFDPERKLWFHLCDGSSRKYFRGTEKQEKQAADGLKHWGRVQ